MIGHSLRRGHSAAFEIDMTEGPLLGKLIRFSLPLALSGLLQLLFNAADMVVVGRFAGSEALAAVGSTGSLNMLIVNLFMGLSIGVNVLVARDYGADDQEGLHKTVHTAILTAAVCGVFLIFAGISLSRPLLQMMETPADVIGGSVLYMRIIFAGMPASMLYNFGSAVLRAVGDTRRPLYFLLTAGIVNVVLNLFFVIALHMGVAGVAVATVISQCISAALVVLCLVHSEGVYQLDLRQLRIHKQKLAEMTRIGIPAGVQGCMFSISNVLIQSTINSFGAVAMAGSTAGSNIEGFVYTGMDAFTQAAQSFVSQNYGAKKMDRVRKTMWLCIGLVTVLGLLTGVAAYLAAEPLLGIYTADPEVIAYGKTRILAICVPYFTCGVMNIFVGGMRGLGSSMVPMVNTIFSVCVLRVVWIYTVFARWPQWIVLFLSYPVTWIIATIIGIGCYFFVKKRAVRAMAG